MGQVLTIHGSATGADPDRFQFRNLTDRAVLDQFLSASPPFVSLAKAIAGRGDALTIDDATRAAADAAFLTRERGHEVTLFVNPGQVESGAPYWFAALNIALDAILGDAVDYDGAPVPIRTVAERAALRSRVKAKVCAIKNEADRLAIVQELARRWCGEIPELPAHLATLSKNDLIELRDAGVEIQNHGWSHSEHLVLSAAESGREVFDGHAWLEREIGVDARFFAAPFGEAQPLAGIPPACDVWLTVNADLKPGLLRPGVFNRVEIDPSSERGRTRFGFLRRLFQDQPLSS